MKRMACMAVVVLAAQLCVSGAPQDHARIERIECRDGRLVFESGREVALFGVNFQTPLSWEYRYQYRPEGIPFESSALNRLTDENLDDLEFLGANIVRVHLTPSDFSDGEGRLRPSPYLDALDHLLARCRQRGIYVYLTLINDMHFAHFPDSFMLSCKREDWLFSEDFMVKAVRFTDELLNHVNPETGTRIADEPAIAVLEPVNEPAYPPFFAERARKVLDSVNRLHAAIRRTGARQPVIWNLNWPAMIDGREDIFQAVAESGVEGVSFCLYPGQADVPLDYWNHPADLSANNYLPYLAKVRSQERELGWVLQDRFKSKAKLVYEFETFFNQSTSLYPAMAALFRSLGVQIATMWHYRLLPPARYLGGSHYLNLYCTPRKALSFHAASEVFHDTPIRSPFPPIQDGRISGLNWAASFPEDCAVFCSKEKWTYTGSDPKLTADPATVRQIAGWGSSRLVSYDGTGAYFLDIQPGEVELRILPDAKFTRPAWEKGPPRKENPPPLCDLKSSVPHRFVLHLPGFDPSGSRVVRVDTGEILPTQEPGLGFDAKPGSYRITGAPANVVTPSSK